MKMKTVIPGEVEKAYWAELTAMLLKYEKGGLSAEIMLAMTSKAVGMLIAMQEPNLMTPDRALMIVQRNIEDGNAQMLTDIATGRLTK